MPGNRKPIDVHVGAKVRLRRIQLDISKEVLAFGLGLAPVEMHGRENGSVRIAAKMLMEISHLLNVKPSYFFEGFFVSHADRLDDTHETIRAAKPVKI